MIRKIEIKNAAKVACLREWNWNSDDNGWRGYHLWYVKSGIGHISVGNEQYDIYGGDCFCFDLSENHICTHNMEHPLVVYTVYFEAELEGERILKRLVHNDPFLGGVMGRSIDSYGEGDRVQAQRWLLPVVGAFTRSGQKEETGDDKMKALCEWLEENVSLNLSLGEIAQKAGYSKNQMIRLFKKEYGVTPVQYFMELKLEQTRKMLLYSSMSVGEIASSVGYYDASHYSKAFKKYVGSGPMEYRKMYLHNDF